MAVAHLLSKIRFNEELLSSRRGLLFSWPPLFSLEPLVFFFFGGGGGAEGGGVLGC